MQKNQEHFSPEQPLREDYTAFWHKILGISPDAPIFRCMMNFFPDYPVWSYYLFLSVTNPIVKKSVLLPHKYELEEFPGSQKGAWDFLESEGRQQLYKDRFINLENFLRKNTLNGHAEVCISEDQYDRFFSGMKKRMESHPKLWIENLCQELFPGDVEGLETFADALKLANQETLLPSKDNDTDEIRGASPSEEDSAWGKSFHKKLMEMRVAKGRPKRT